MMHILHYIKTLAAIMKHEKKKIKLHHFELAKWLVHRSTELVSRVRYSARSTYMIHKLYFTNMKT